MGIISRMRKQNAIYWPPSTEGDFGRLSAGSLVELTLSGGVNSRVRWEDKAKNFIDKDGNTQMSRAIVYCPVLPAGGEVAIGGFLWLGDRADLTSEANPKANAGAWEIQQVDKIPNLKASEFLRVAYL